MMYKFLSVVLSACLLTGSVSGPLMGYGMGQEIVVEEETTEDTVSGNTVSDNVVEETTEEDTTPVEESTVEETATEEETTVAEDTTIEEETTTEEIQEAEEQFAAEEGTVTLTVNKIDAYSNSVKITVKTTVTNYTGTNRTYFYYKPKNSEEWLYQRKNLSMGYTTTVTINDLLEQTAYEFRIGLSEQEGLENLAYTVSGEFTTAVDDREIELTDFAVYSDNAIATVLLSGKAAANQQTRIGVYYKIKNSTSTYAMVSNSLSKAGSTEINLQGLLPDTEYEYIYGRANKLTGQPTCLHTQYTGTFTTLAEDRTATFTDIKPLLYGIKVTVDVDGENALGNNGIWLYYKKKGASDNDWNSTIEIVNGDAPKTITLNEMEADTEYEYVFGIGKNGFVSREDLISPKSGTFKTLKDDRTAVLEAIMPKLDRADFTVSMKGKAMEGIQTEGYIRVRKKGDERYQYAYMHTYEGAGKYTYSLGGSWGNPMTEDTEYEYEIGINEGNIDLEEDRILLKSGTFKTLKDDRKLDVSVSPQLKTASATISLSGEAANAYTLHSIEFYFRPKGEEKWIIYSYSIPGNGNINFGISNLLMATTYEYWAGIKKSVKTENGTETVYVGKAEGEFTTKSDTRKLEKVQVFPEYSTANVVVNGAGMKDMSSCYQVYYREAGETEWLNYTISYGRNMQTEEVTILCRSLKAGTEYEYAVVLADNSNQINPDEYDIGDKKIAGTFKTKSADYSLQVTQNNEKTTTDSATFNLQATGTNQDSTLRVKLYYSYNNVWERYINVDLLQSAQYKNSIVIDDLEQNTTYDFTQANFYIMEGEKLSLIGTQSLQGTTFQTLSGGVTEKITTSKDEVWLNAGANSDPGYGKATITLGTVPENANADLYVKTADSKYVSYQLADNQLQLTAVAPGDTEVIVADRNSTTVEKSIKVHVGEYSMGYDSNNGALDTNDVTVSMGCGDTKTVGYYDISKDEPVLLENVTVTNYDEGILQITEEGNQYVILAKRAGTGYVAFEKDNFKKKIEFRVSNPGYEYTLSNVTSNNDQYPVIKEGDNKYILALADENTYKAEIIFAPYIERGATYFNWTSSDTSVATVANGVITPVKAGTTTITMEPKYSGYMPESLSFMVEVKELSNSQQNGTISFILNKKKNPKLKDVAFPMSWGDGWEWKYPETKLLEPVDSEEPVEFEAVYTQENKYPCIKKVKVYVVKYDKLNVYEKNAKHPNNVLEIENTENEINDSISVQVYPKGRGGYAGFHTDLTCKKSGLTIEQERNHTYKITAQKAGTYTLTANLYEDATGNKLMSATYKVKAVKEKQVDRISFNLLEDDFTLTGENNIVIDDPDYVGKTITISAKALASDKTVLSTPLTWKSSDPKTISIKCDKKNTHNATITIKATGNATIYVTAKDATKNQEVIKVANKYAKPTMVKNKATVNLACDYVNYYPIDLIEGGGCLSIINNGYSSLNTSSIHLRKLDNTPESNLCLSPNWKDDRCDFLVKPTNDKIPTGTYKCKLVVSTGYPDCTYEYPVTISVINKQPKIAVKTTKKVNLFYTADEARLELSIPQNTYCRTVSWTDNSSGGDGFVITKQETGSGRKEYITFSAANVKTKGNKLLDPKVAKGTLAVTINGYKDPVIIKNVKIGYMYKKPTLLVNSGNKKTLTVTTGLGNNEFGFNMYDSLTKGMLSMDEDYAVTDPYYYYDIKSNNPRIETTVNTIYVGNIYNSSKSKETVEYTVSSYAWREPLKLKLTIKTKKAKAILSKNAITYNKNHNSLETATVYTYGAGDNFSLSGIDFKGTNAKSEELLKQNILQADRTSSTSSSMQISLNKIVLDKLGNSVKDGTYTFKVTPYYRHPDTGELTKLNTLTLKVKLVSKAVTVKVTPKGTLDTLLSHPSNNDWKYRVQLQTKFSNIDEDCYIRNVKLVGGYADYFELKRNYSSDGAPYYLVISEDSIGKVKSGQTYNLQLEYTISTSSSNNHTFVVKSDVFKLKAKQSVPKLKVDESSFILYARKDSSYAKRIEVTIPKGYRMKECGGYLDLDRDGVAEINVTQREYSGSIVVLEACLMNPYRLDATESGKTYTVPVTFKMVGRDGVAKDPVVNLKIKVKH